MRISRFGLLHGLQGACDTGASRQRDFQPTRKGALALALVVTAMVTVADAQPALDLEDCRVDGVSVPARCGALTVFEDRATGAGRTIDLKIVVIPAVSGSPEPDTLFFLAGGPGQAATDLADTVLVRLAEVRRSRDIVFVDQRGTGGSGRMSCALFETSPDEEASGESLQLDAFPLDDLRDCLAEVESATDPRHYTTPVAMDDLDDVRAALGYETINLYGGSYGTRAGLIYMRRHPERVRTAVLDGLAPVSMRLPSSMNADAQRALDLVLIIDEDYGQHFRSVQPATVRLVHDSSRRASSFSIRRARN